MSWSSLVHRISVNLYERGPREALRPWTVFFFHVSQIEEANLSPTGCYSGTKGDDDLRVMLLDRNTPWHSHLKLSKQEWHLGMIEKNNDTLFHHRNNLSIRNWLKFYFFFLELDIFVTLTKASTQKHTATMRLSLQFKMRVWHGIYFVTSTNATTNTNRKTQRYILPLKIAFD